jgi:hypothetical protein
VIPDAAGKCAPASPLTVRSGIDEGLVVIAVCTLGNGKGLTMRLRLKGRRA